MPARPPCPHTAPDGAPDGAPAADASPPVDEIVAACGLSPRQAAVARLMAEGRTNPEIARTLAISRYTARNHAAAVLARLAVSSRGHVAAAIRAAAARRSGAAR